MYRTLYCYQKHTNLASQRTAMAMGFRQVEAYPDEVNGITTVYAMTKAEWRARAGEDNPVLDAIRDRRSYRGAYATTPVPRHDLAAILQAGCDAPSGCNKQTASFVAVDDADVLARIKAVIDPPVAESAPAMIAVLTRRINAYRDKCFAVQDYSAAIENMLLAIHALGYASCWYEGHITDDDRICDKIAAILNVPEEYDLVCILPVGVPLQAVPAPKKKAFAEKAFFNSFGES